MTGLAQECNSPRSEKVVVQFGARTIKGYLECPEWDYVEELLTNAFHHPPATLRIRSYDSDIIENIAIADVKAIYYVNSFDGNAEHKPLNFHARTPIAQGIWVRLHFIDGEVMEGLVYNSMRYLVDPGFFVLPTDPDSNNKLAYVLKSWLVDLRVLGIRKLRSESRVSGTSD